MNNINNNNNNNSYHYNKEFSNFRPSLNSFYVLWNSYHAYKVLLCPFHRWGIKSTKRLYHLSALVTIIGNLTLSTFSDEKQPLFILMDSESEIGTVPNRECLPLYFKRLMLTLSYSAFLLLLTCSFFPLCLEKYLKLLKFIKTCFWPNM